MIPIVVRGGDKGKNTPRHRKKKIEKEFSLKRGENFYRGGKESRAETPTP